MRRVNVTTFWNRLSSVVVFLLFVLGGLAVGIWYLPEIQRNQELQTERLRLERQLAAAQTHGRSLQASLKAFTNNPVAAERIIRERFGFARPGEVVVHFAPPAADATPARP
jgi:cell division protein FtsB